VAASTALSAVGATGGGAQRSGAPTRSPAKKKQKQKQKQKQEKKIGRGRAQSAERRQCCDRLQMAGRNKKEKGQIFGQEKEAEGGQAVVGSQWEY
jgi:hypothetical protein